MSDKASAKQQYYKWKLAIPYLYDWFTNHNLTWPSLSCRWGAPVEESAYKRKQYIYLSERTDASEPNKLTLVPVELYKPRVAAAEAISGFHEAARSPFIGQAKKTIMHQGEVNKIRELPQDPNIVTTHSDAREVYVWHFGRQPDRGVKKDDWKKLSEPDLLLTGHRDIAEFALATSSGDPVVASGGTDTDVLLWNLKDFDGGSLLDSQPRSSPVNTKSSSLPSTTTLKGHKSTIGDVAFQPRSHAELGTVADDCALLLWDARSGQAPVAQVSNAHRRAELRCIDWSGQDTNLVATGAEDGSLKVWDRRRLGTAAHAFDLHSNALIRVEWSNYKPGVFASGGEDGVVCIWDLMRRTNSQAEAGPDGVKARTAIPPELTFQHAGHQVGQIADFQWHPTDPYTLVSVSDDPAGGTLQLWRVNDLIYRPEDEVIAELERYRDEILPRERPRVRRMEAENADAGSTPEPSAAAARPPMSTGGGSAPAATPAGAFVGVPEGVPVAAADAPQPVDEA